MSNTPRSVAELSLGFTGTFEAELLTELMLREWKHPLAADKLYRNGLLESAADVLRSSVAGEKLMEDVSPANVSLVAALWIAESMTLNSDTSIAPVERAARAAWLDGIRRALPSCFCEPDLLS